MPKSRVIEGRLVGGWGDFEGRKLPDVWDAGEPDIGPLGQDTGGDSAGDAIEIVGEDFGAIGSAIAIGVDDADDSFGLSGEILPIDGSVLVEVLEPAASALVDGFEERGVIGFGRSEDALEKGGAFVLGAQGKILIEPTGQVAYIEDAGAAATGFDDISPTDRIKTDAGDVSDEGFGSPDRQLESGRNAKALEGRDGIGRRGGGGGSESDDIDLRAAYDRIVAGMSEKDVIRAVGREPNGVDIRRYDWSDGNGQLLLVRFLSDDSGIVSSVDWNKLTVPTGSLNKRFD